MNKTPANTVEPISNSSNPVQNIIPPIDVVPTSEVLGETPKKKNYLPWLLGILVLCFVLALFFLILTNKNKPTPTLSLIQPSVSQEQTRVAATDIDTSSWKTYTIPFGNLSLPLSKQDAELKNKTLTFKYPTDWKIVDRKNSDKSGDYAYDLDFYLVKSDPNEQVACSSKDSPCSLEGISPLSTQISLSLNAIPDGADVLSVNYWGQLNVFSKKSETRIDKTKVTQGFVNENDDIPSDLIFDMDKNKLRVNIHGLDYASKETSKEIKQILSTFKFIQTNDSEIIVPNVIQQLIPQVKWEPKQSISKYPLLDFGGSVLVSQRVGTIINPDIAGNPYNIRDLLHDKSKLTELGWIEAPPKGASGPLTSITDYHKAINGVDKVLRFVIENTDYTSSANPSDNGTKIKCPCVNKITVYQQQ